MTNYKISKAAINDLESIWLYTLEKWSKNQADRYFNLIIDEIEFIASHSDLGKSIETTRKNYRYTKVKSHLIFYRQQSDIIEIVRILHQRMDLKKHLQ